METCYTHWVGYGWLCPPRNHIGGLVPSMAMSAVVVPLRDGIYGRSLEKLPSEGIRELYWDPQVFLKASCNKTWSRPLNHSLVSCLVIWTFPVPHIPTRVLSLVLGHCQRLNQWGCHIRDFQPPNCKLNRCLFLIASLPQVFCYSNRK